MRKFHPNSFINFCINETAGDVGIFRATMLGQIAIGILYSFGHFDLLIVGIIIGYILPIIWLIASYRFLKYLSIDDNNMPFPVFIKKDPGNFLVIILDILFLSTIWFIIISGYYDAIWLRTIITILFPILTLSMMRSLILLSNKNNRTNSD